jgi:hypothetical protein
MPCSTCEEFNAPNYKEAFCLRVPYPLWFDIALAEQIIKDKPRKAPWAGEADVALFKDIIAYPPVEGKIYVLRISINEGHLDHVDMTKPIIIVPRPKVTLAEGDIVIDGHHRIARAMRDGLKTIKFVVLTREETQTLIPRDARDDSREAKAFLKRVERRRQLSGGGRVNA